MADARMMVLRQAPDRATVPTMSATDRRRSIRGVALGRCGAPVGRAVITVALALCAAGSLPAMARDAQRGTAVPSSDGLDEWHWATETYEAAEGGDAKAQVSVGTVYAKGEDYEEAAIWFRKAAKQGNPDAQFMLGVMYRGGQGVTQDDREAASWFHRAAEQGEPEAQFALGLMYGTGTGVAKDDHQAILWVRKAAELGLAEAQHTLGTVYRDGTRVTQWTSLRSQATFAEARYRW